MKTFNQTVSILALAVLFSSGTALAADAAQKYPDRPIRLIMPNAPGSANDTMGRILAAKLGEALGQQIRSEEHTSELQSH